jgi:aryl-alcohol dehydrogenase-like predicted oxidoreductase
MVVEIRLQDSFSNFLCSIEKNQQMIGLETIRLGRTGGDITRLGMGCWAIGGHGWGQVREEDSIRAIKSALDNGITFFDTADAYGLGKSELLLAKVMGDHIKKVTIGSKGGVRWNESGKVWTDSSPAYLRSAVENSLRRLKLECIPLYYIHRLDGTTPLQESISALERFRREGKIGAIGVSNFSKSQLIQALETAPIDTVQVRLNIFDREASNDLLEVCRRHGIILVAWGALADGFLTGKFVEGTKFFPDDHRSRIPEFHGEKFLNFKECLNRLIQLAEKRRIKVSQLVLRWVLDFEPFTCALFGAKTDIQVTENLGANGWNLTGKELESIESIFHEYRRSYALSC